MERMEDILSLLGAAETGFEESAGRGEESEVSAAGADGSVEGAMLCLGGYTVLMGGECRHGESSDRARGREKSACERDSCISYMQLHIFPAKKLRRTGEEGHRAPDPVVATVIPEFEGVWWLLGGVGF